MKKIISLKRLSKALNTHEGTLMNLINSINPGLLVRLPAMTFVDLNGVDRDVLLVRLKVYSAKRGLRFDISDIEKLSEAEMKLINDLIGNNNESKV